MAKPGSGAAAAIAGRRQAHEYDASAIAKAREATPVKIGELTFRRRRKTWDVSRLMRTITRVQESAMAKRNRLMARIAELEVDQIEAASKGDTDTENELETTIEGLVATMDNSTELAELTTYRLIALLLVPPVNDVDDAVVAVPGFGPEHADDAEAAAGAIGFLQAELDVEDASQLVRELTGSVEPDPQTTPSNESGST